MRNTLMGITTLLAWGIGFSTAPVAATRADEGAERFDPPTSTIRDLACKYYDGKPNDLLTGGLGWQTATIPQGAPIPSSRPPRNCAPQPSTTTIEPSSTCPREAVTEPCTDPR